MRRTSLFVLALFLAASPVLGQSAPRSEMLPQIRPGTELRTAPLTGPRATIRPRRDAETPTRPQVRPGAGTVLELDGRRAPGVRPPAEMIPADRLRLKPDLEILLRQRPEIGDMLERYPQLRQVRPVENAEVAQRFPGVTVDMLEALQHFDRTGLPQVVEIDRSTLPDRFLRPVPDYSDFFARNIQQPDLFVVPDLDLIDPADRTTFQTVSPELTIRFLLNQPEASEWLARVREASAYEIDAVNSCQNALRSLFDVACGGNPTCGFEEAYLSRCLSAGTTQDTAEDCVAAVDAYHDLCFGGSCPIAEAGWPAASIGRPEDVACSAALVAPGGSGTPALIATVDHCEDYVDEGAANRLGQSDRPAAPVSDARRAALGFGDAVRLYTLAAGRLGEGAPTAAPERYAETVLLAFNQLMALRNRVAERFGIAGRTEPPMICDASALCTVTEIRPDGTLDHTCQSTRGGSGGALVQFEPGGRPRIVGLNMGAPSPGMVAINLGVAVTR